MAEIRTVTTLRRKREEIRRTIIAYEERLAQAKADLAHISAAITVFEGEGESGDHRAYVDIHRVFKHRELMDLARRALGENGPMDTRELARYITSAKGLDPTIRFWRRRSATKSFTPCANNTSVENWAMLESAAMYACGH